MLFLQFHQNVGSYGFVLQFESGLMLAPVQNKCYATDLPSRVFLLSLLRYNLEMQLHLKFDFCGSSPSPSRLFLASP